MIVVVGNGVPGAGNGPRIDAADYVIRCNEAWKMLGGDFGTKTDALCCKGGKAPFLQWCKSQGVEVWDIVESPIILDWTKRFGMRTSRGVMAIMMAYERLGATDIKVAACNAVMSGTPHLAEHYDGKRRRWRRATHDFEAEKVLLDTFCDEYGITLEVLRGRDSYLS